MHLLVIHYHWRPGGVRRAVELTLAQLAADPAGRVRRVLLASGERPPADWAHHVAAIAGGVFPIEWIHLPWLSYAGAWPGPPKHALAAATASIGNALKSLPSPRVVLLENPVVGRHPVLGRAASEACAAASTRLICRHHDFFFDGRWDHWSSMLECGLGSVDEAIEHALPVGSHVTHVAVSARDAAWLSSFRDVAFIPLPRGAAPHIRCGEVAEARAWLEKAAGAGSGNAVWLCPTRVLRRKNLVEGAMMARLIEGEATVVVTGAVSSPEESGYAHGLKAIANSPNAGLRLGVLAALEARGIPAPSVSQLMAAADRCVVTSLFEGFGLPAVEAGSQSRPLLARWAACPDESASGNVDVYDELRLAWHLVGGQAERARQENAWRLERKRMPAEWAVGWSEPAWWANPDELPCSRLTLAGQLHAWNNCLDSMHRDEVAARNPWIEKIRARSKSRPSSGVGSQSPPGHGPVAPAGPHQMAEILFEPIPASFSHKPKPSGPTPDAVRARLLWANNYPLLWPGGSSLPNS